MKDDRYEWVTKVLRGELTLNGLELLMSQRHSIYCAQFEKQHLNTNLVSNEA